MFQYLSTSHDIPMLLTRQTHKTYGTGRLVEGHYKAKDVVLLLDDVLMTGGTVLQQVPVGVRHLISSQTHKNILSSTTATELYQYSLVTNF